MVNTSDEPDRVALIMEELFAGQANSWAETLDNGATARLTVGADDKDDCAVFRVNGELEIVMGSDYVRGPKFALYELGLLSEYDLGYYLAIANLSDIAAMGAMPAGLLSVVRYPPGMDDERFLDVLTGIRDACALHNVRNVGGDIGSAERLILSASAVGFAEPDKVLRRSTASDGECLVVSGPTGIAGAAMTYFSARDRNEVPKLTESQELLLLAAWRRPTAEVDLGRALARHGLATAAQDTSDGLKATIEQIAASSGLGAEVDLEQVPIHPVVAAVADLIGQHPHDFAFGNSVDFRLLYSVRESDLDQLRENTAIGKSTVIGHLTASPFVGVKQNGGPRRALPGVAWRHQVDTPTPSSGS